MIIVKKGMSDMNCYYGTPKRGFEIEVLVGLPASGKSTYAKAKESNGYVVVSKDDIRLKCARKMNDSAYDAPEGYFKPSELHHFSKVCNVIINDICDSIVKWIANKSFYENNLNRKSLHEYTDEEYEAIQKVYSEYLNQVYKAKHGVIFDATYYTKKSRVMFPAKFKDCGVKLIARYFDCTLEEAIKGNEERKQYKTLYNGKEYEGRRVPDDALRNMYNNLTLPSVEEGFHVVVENKPCYAKVNGDKLVQMYYNFDNYSEDEIADIFPNDYFKRCINFNQCNSHHTLTLSQHMYHSAKYVKEHGGNLTTFIAALLHDVGKADTKGLYGRLNREFNGYKNNKELEIVGEDEVFHCVDPFSKHKIDVPMDYLDVDRDCHYYNHHVVSALKAWQMLKGMCDERMAKDVYNLIYHHMAIPFKSDDISTKALNKIKKYLGVEGLHNLALIREADLYAKDLTPPNIPELVTSIKNYQYI